MLLSWDPDQFLYVGSGYCDSCRQYYPSDLWKSSISFSNLNAVPATCGVDLPTGHLGLSLLDSIVTQIS